MEKIGASALREEQLSGPSVRPHNIGTSSTSSEEPCFAPNDCRGSTSKRPAPIQESSSDMENDGSTPEGPGSSNTDCTNEESMSSHSNKSCSTSVSSVSSQNDGNESEGQEKAAKRSKGSKPKKDRSKLRKGKWTVEEEEYTSRIIHYFISGLLTLPEGATLRSYLADKLNCDPMRITKKYAGASCLGRRVYHFRDRVHPTVGEIQVAKVELDHLEQRFRVRIEGGQSTWSASSPSDVAQVLARQNGGTMDTSGIPQQVATSTATQAQNLLQSMLMGMGGNQDPNAALPQAPVAAAVPPMFGFPVAGVPGAAPPIPPALAQLLVPSAIAAGTEALGVQSQLLAATPQMQGVDPSILSWAFSQAAASLGPALTHLAAANIQQAQQAQLQALQQNQQAQQQAQQQQVQLQAQQQQQVQLQAQQQQQQQAQIQAQQLFAQHKTQLQAQLREQQANVHQQLEKLQSQQRPAAAEAPPLPPPQTSPQTKPLTSDDRAKVFAAELKLAFDRHMKSLDGTSEQATNTSMEKPKEGVSATVHVIATNTVGAKPAPNESQDHPRTDADNEGGTALLGFLSSLRKSYEDVLRDKQGFEGGKSESSYDTTSNRGATVTDSNSTQQRDSSVEDSDWNSDWNSDKKTDPSSSEDSDKEVSHRDKKVHSSKGPPRKRMKVKKVADEVRKGPAN